MKRQTQTLLYHLLPVAFWLLAIGGSLVPLALAWLGWMDLDGSVKYNYFYGFAVALVVLLCVFLLVRIQRHTSAVVPCFQVAVLSGIASYWLPTVLFLVFLMWIYLAYRNLLDLRAFMAQLTGYALVAVWAAVAIWAGWMDNPWMDFWAIENTWGWIPTGAFLIACIASTIVRQNLRVR